MEQNHAKEMDRPWIKSFGKVSQEDVSEFIMKMFGGEEEEVYFLAAHSDKYMSGRLKKVGLTEVDNQHLLEMRAFTGKKELLMNRTMLGRDFTYPLADDEMVDDCYMLEHIQYLDINAQKSSYNTTTGQYEIMSTVGGRYTMPINEEVDRIKIKSYILYDDSGMAKVVDNRVVGFLRREEK